jgi:hypothetical protein
VSACVYGHTRSVVDNVSYFHSVLGPRLRLNRQMARSVPGSVSPTGTPPTNPTGRVRSYSLFDIGSSRLSRFLTSSGVPGRSRRNVLSVSETSMQVLGQERDRGLETYNPHNDRRYNNQGRTSGGLQKPHSSYNRIPMRAETRQAFSSSQASAVNCDPRTSWCSFVGSPGTSCNRTSHRRVVWSISPLLSTCPKAHGAKRVD